MNPEVESGVDSEVVSKVESGIDFEVDYVMNFGCQNGGKLAPK